MGLTECKSYTLTCDECGEVFEEQDTGFSIFDDEDDAIELASYAGWHIINASGEDRCRCPACQENSIDL